MDQNQTLLCYVYVIPVILVLFSKLFFLLVSLHTLVIQ